MFLRIDIIKEGHSTSRAITSLSTNVWRLFLSSAEFSKNHMHVTRNQARNEGGGMSGRSGLWTDDELANRKKRSSLSSSLSLFRAGRQTSTSAQHSQRLFVNENYRCVSHSAAATAIEAQSAPLARAFSTACLLARSLPRPPYDTPFFSLQISFDPVLLLVLPLSCDSPGSFSQSGSQSVGTP